MKSFLSMFVACALALAVVLFVHDVFVAQPREARVLAAQQAALDAAATAGFSGQREEAAKVADALNASIDRSIGNARDAMARDAAAADTRARIADGLNRAAMFKLAVAETYMSTGRWPQQASDAGLGAPEDYAAGAVAGIALGADGVVTIRYTAVVADAAAIRLIPSARADMGSVDWRCEADGFADKSLLPTVCR